MDRRVLHVSMPTVAGVPRVLMGYLTHQVEQGWTAAVACPGTGWLARAAESAGARVLPWEATRAPGSRVADETVRLGRLIDAYEPDVIHLHSAKAGLAGRLAVRGRRATVFQPHAWSFLAAAGPVGAAALRWERFAARWTHAVLCVSDGERNAGVARGVRAPYHVVRNGVDLAAWTAADDAERSAARARLGLSSAPLTVCVGRLCQQKGQADLLAAWPAVRRFVPDAQLVLVGDGPDRTLLERRAAALPGVRLVGERIDTMEWMAAADVVAVPSRWDGMALVVLEAMARARSVVATAVDGVADALPPTAGAVVPPRDPPAFAAQLIRRLDDRARRRAEGEAGRRFVELNLDTATSARAVVMLYDELTGRRAVRRPTPRAASGGPSRAGYAT